MAWLFPLVLSAAAMQSGGIVPMPHEHSRLLTPSSGESVQVQQDVAVELKTALAALLPEGAPEIELSMGPVSGDHPEAYWIESDAELIRVQGQTYAGLARGVARLPQLVQADGSVERQRIVDYPETEWRGVMIDVARFPHSARDVEDAIQLAWLLGMNRVHLHLTDDQLFTFPSRAFPELGSVRGDGTRLHYTREELDALVHFADVRGIQLIPEVDMPAHAGVMVRARPDLFGTTDPETGEAKSTGIVNMANERAYESLEILLAEVAEVFWNSEYIHLGADEVWAQHLRDLPEYKEYCAKHELPLALKGNVGELYAHFVARTCGMVRDLGKRPIVWEGFHGTGTAAAPIPRDILVMAWNLTFQSPESLVASGYEIINCSWDPMYIVPAQCYAPLVADALDWRLNEFRQRYGGPRFTLPEDAPILGGQMCIWEQRPEAILPSSYEVMAAVAERMWNASAPTDEAGHLERRRSLDAVMQHYFGERVRQQWLPAEKDIELGEDFDLGPLWAWVAAWPIPLGTGEVLNPHEQGVKARGLLPVMTPERAKRVNHELFARVREQGHVDTRIPAPPMESLSWMPRRQWQPYALELAGYLELPEAGEWTFFVRANDGAAELALGSSVVATSRGNRQAQGAADLEAGVYDVRVRFHYEYVQNELNLMAKGPGMDQAAPLETYLISSYQAAVRTNGLGGRGTTPVDTSAIVFLDPSKKVYRSLATGKPVTATAPHQGPNVLSNVVDGVVGNESGWHCGESPASLTVDLGEVHPINRAQVHLYHDGGRYYQYRVEASADGELWLEVVDASANTSKSTAKGMEHRFDVTPARYVRLVMLKNSANPGVHVNELLIFADGAAPK